MKLFWPLFFIKFLQLNSSFEIFISKHVTKSFAMNQSEIDFISIIVNVKVANLYLQKMDLITQRWYTIDVRIDKILQRI